jgi:hypothetical protein
MIKYHDHVRDFAFDELSSFLGELGCDGAAQSRIISWYWKTAPGWVTSAQSRFEFNAVAKHEIRSELRGTPPEQNEYERELARCNQFLTHQSAEVLNPSGLVAVTSWTPCTHWGGNARILP